MRKSPAKKRKSPVKRKVMTKHEHEILQMTLNTLMNKVKDVNSLIIIKDIFKKYYNIVPSEIAEKLNKEDIIHWIEIAVALRKQGVKMRPDDLIYQTFYQFVKPKKNYTLKEVVDLFNYHTGSKYDWAKWTRV